MMQPNGTPSLDTERLARCQRAHDAATANLFERQKELAALGEPPVEPVPWWPLVFLVTLGLSVTLATALHGILVGQLVEDALDGLLASFALGAVLSGGIVATLVWTAHMAAPGARRPWLGMLTANLLFGAGMLLTRLVAPGASPTLALGLTLFEVALLTAIEVACGMLAERRSDWAIRRDAWTSAVAQVEVAEEHVAVRRGEVGQAHAPSRGANDGGRGASRP